MSILEMIAQWVKPERVTGFVAAAAKMKAEIELNSDPQLLRQIRMIRLEESDLMALAAFQPYVVKHADELTDSFYQAVYEVPELVETIETHSSVERLKQTLRVHLIEMFDGKLDRQYVQKRYRIAQVHNRIGLEPKWYMGAFQNINLKLIDLVYRYGSGRDDTALMTRAISKILNLEQQIVLDIYEREHVQERDAQYEKVKRLLKSKMAEFTGEMAALAEQTNASVEELIASSVEVKRRMFGSVQSSLNMKKLALSGQDEMQALREQIGELEQLARSMEQAVRRMNEYSGEIWKITGVVREIAEQTKLLSLNAALEAARAGEYGVGFHIVAQEVKKLSMETTAAAQNIADLIESFGDHIHEVVAGIDTAGRTVERGQRQADRTTTLFRDIMASMEDSLQGFEQIEAEMNALAKVIEEIGTATTQVATTSDELNQATRDL